MYIVCLKVPHVHARAPKHLYNLFSPFGETAQDDALELLGCIFWVDLMTGIQQQVGGISSPVSLLLSD